MRKKVLISTSTFAEFDRTPLELLERERFSYVLNPHRRKLTGTEVVDLGRDAVGIVAGTEKLTGEVFEQLPSLEVVSRCGTGMDNVDMESARKRNIRIYNTPDGPTRAVAELTVAVILDLLRKVSFMDRRLRQGEWKKMMGSLLFGKKIGIIGFGRIGQAVSELLSAFGTELAYCDVVSRSCRIDCGKKSLEQMLKWADLVTLHLAPPPGADAIITSREISLMKKGAWLVNFSRGGAVDEKALYEALKEGDLAGAALDVFQNEPYRGPLASLDNVVLTPHAGSYAREARVRMEIQAVENLLAGFKEK
ncbi:MAG: hydroxyacid dehydrogenase [Candidatus Omnitrophica bacterium]|nr:hydroxyacid dehydrogenase [Candidatus Omnitrophota bacterium]